VRLVNIISWSRREGNRKLDFRHPHSKQKKHMGGDGIITKSVFVRLFPYLQWVNPVLIYGFHLISVKFVYCKKFCGLTRGGRGGGT
jgi:hypothetical protein